MRQNIIRLSLFLGLLGTAFGSDSDYQQLGKGRLQTLLGAKNLDVTVEGEPTAIYLITNHEALDTGKLVSGKCVNERQLFPMFEESDDDEVSVSFVKTDLTTVLEIPASLLSTGSGNSEIIEAVAQFMVPNTVLNNGAARAIPLLRAHRTVSTHEVPVSVSYNSDGGGFSDNDDEEELLTYTIFAYKITTSQAVSKKARSLLAVDNLELYKRHRAESEFIVNATEEALLEILLED